MRRTFRERNSLSLVRFLKSWTCGPGPKRTSVRTTYQEEVL